MIAPDPAGGTSLRDAVDARASGTFEAVTMHDLVLGPHADRSRVRWLVQLRWFAVAGVAATTAAAALLFGSLTFAIPVAAILAGLCAFNVWLTRRIRTGLTRFTSPSLQVTLDLLALTALLAVTGGLVNPFSGIPVFQVILAGILLPRRHATRIGILSIALLGILFATSLLDVPPRPTGGPLAGFRPPPLLLAGAFAALSLIVLVSLRFTMLIMDDLRRAAHAAGRARERTEAENLQLARTEKLAAIGRLAAGVAHELSTPLGSIAIFAGEGLHAVRRMAESCSESRELSDYLAEIQKETRRCAAVSRGLLDLARPEEDLVEEIVVADLLRETLRLAASRGPGRRADIAVRVTPPDARIASVPAFLRQVLLNILQNALDAAGPSGRVSADAVLEGEILRFRVADDGPGIPERYRGRLFEPFFTTKARGEGTGLGLYVSEMLVKSLGGRIAIASKEGAGTTVSIEVPRRAGPRRAAAPANP